MNPNTPRIRHDRPRPAPWRWPPRSPPPPRPRTITYEGDTLVYTAAPGEANRTGPW